MNSRNILVSKKGKVRVNDIVRTVIDFIEATTNTSGHMSGELECNTEFLIDVRNAGQIKSLLQVFIDGLLVHKSAALNLLMFTLSVLRGLHITISYSASGRLAVLPYISCGMNMEQPVVLVGDSAHVTEMLSVKGYDAVLHVNKLDAVQMLLLAALLDSYDGPCLIPVTSVLRPTGFCMHVHEVNMPTYLHNLTKRDALKMLDMMSRELKS